MLFDQRYYTGRATFDEANLDLTGWAYIPNRCANNTVEQCKLNILFGGCSTKYPSWNSVIENHFPSMEDWITSKYGFGQMAHANDQILLMPGRRDKCWDMGHKATSLMQFTNDPNYLNKKGKQNKAIMNMVE